MDTHKHGESQRVIGIDFGLRRIGLAIGDTESGLATPMGMIESQTDMQAAEIISQMVAREKVEIIVCGVPFNDDGTAGPQARRTMAFIDFLQRHTGRSVVVINEFLTTHDAESLLAGHFTAAQKKRRIDAVAAARILQSYLDQNRPSAESQDDF